MEKIRDKLITCQVVLWTNTTNKEGKHPIKIRVTNNRKSKYYSVQMNKDGIKKLFLTKDEWEKARQEKPRGVNRERQWWIKKAETDAYKASERATENSRPFSFERFESELLAKDDESGILNLFERNLKTLLQDGQIGTYKTYKCAYNAFKLFRDGKDINPADISPRLLKSFENYLLTPKLGKHRKTLKAANKTTVAIYMRTLKKILNIAIDQNPSLKAFYPFAQRKGEKNRYTIRTGSGKKGEALKIDELQKFISLETQPGTPEHEVRLLWLFSFYCQGMNFRDMANLKYKDIQPNFIEYVRSKTERTEKHEQKMQVPLSDAIVKIIVELGNQDKRKEAYVFGIIHESMTPVQRDSVIRDKIKTTNKRLKHLCERNDMPAITTYWARHSYASMLKELNEPIEMIRELLGHSDIKTTESYLKRFDLDRKREANQKITTVLNISK